VNRATLAVGFVLFVAMMGSNVPAPLYELYRVHFATTTFVMTGVFAIYPIALVLMLIAFARLPDAIGRRPVLVLSIVAAALGTIAFAVAQSVAVLFAGRVLAAVAIGAAGAAGPPALVELDAAHDRRRAALVATFAFSLGCGVSPFMAGLLAVATPWPLVAPFVAQLVLCAVAFAALALIPESRPARTSAAAPAEPLTAPARRAFAAAMLTSGIVWWLASLFISILPAFVATLLGVRSPAIQGAIALAVFAISPLAQVAGRGISDRFASRAGLIGTVVALAAILGAVPLHSLLLLGAGTVVAGIAHGLGFLGAQSTVNRVAPAAARARLSALFYAFTYACIGVTVLVVGALTERLGLYDALAIVAASVAAAALILAAILPRGEPAAG
jgi:predicted MFS family arabinose efflux permease